MLYFVIVRSAFSVLFRSFEFTKSSIFLRFGRANGETLRSSLYPWSTHFVQRENWFERRRNDWSFRSELNTEYVLISQIECSEISVYSRTSSQPTGRQWDSSLRQQTLPLAGESSLDQLRYCYECYHVCYDVTKSYSFVHVVYMNCPRGWTHLFTCLTKI